MGNGPLFRQTINDRMRALIRAEFGWSAETVAKIKDKELALCLYEEAEKRELLAIHVAKAPEWIAAGYLTEREFEEMTRSELRQFARKLKALQHFEAVERGDTYEITSAVRASKKSETEAKEIDEMPTIDTLKREEQLSVLADMLALIATQQAQIDQLRKEVASLKNANLAVFGHQQVIEQLTTVPRDFEGVEVHMTLEEQATESEEGTFAATEKRAGSIKDARDAVAGIEGLASFIAGLDIKRNVNFDSVNEATRKMSEHSKTLMKTRSKGEVHVKFAKVTGGTAALAVGSGAVRDLQAPAPVSVDAESVEDPFDDGAVGNEIDP